MGSEGAATLRGIETLKEGSGVVFHRPLQSLEYELCIGLPEIIPWSRDRLSRGWCSGRLGR
jgi:hypothetical protein